MLRFDKATYLVLLLKSIWSKRLNNNLGVSEFYNTITKLYYYTSIYRIHKYSILLFYNFDRFIMLLYTFLVISSSQYKKYMIWRISFSKFSDVLPAFTCASAIDNHWGICLGINILNLFSCFEWNGALYSSPQPYYIMFLFVYQVAYFFRLSLQTRYIN